MIPLALLLLGGGALLLLSSPTSNPETSSGGGNDTPPDPGSEPNPGAGGDNPPPDVPTPVPQSSPAVTRFLSHYADSEYKPLIEDAEQANNLPDTVLAALLWQESRFNPAAHNDASGAMGIAQILPATAAAPGYGVAPINDPLDPQQAIPFAGAYLAAMIRETGSVADGLAAYNWGLGHVRGGGAWPAETATYVATITANAGVA